MGLYAVWEVKAEARYLPQALAIVRRMWADYPVATIAMEITKHTRFKCDVKLVYGLKARLDTIDRNAAE